jgi:hypothetical protein
VVAGGRRQADGAKPEVGEEARGDPSAAIEIINVKGYALATMTEIAAALDLRDAALYYYFPNKQALVFACHQRSLERFEAYPARRKVSARPSRPGPRACPSGWSDSWKRAWPTAPSRPASRRLWCSCWSAC